MKHELWYSVVVRDRHGKVVSRERRRSRSFLKQWNQLVYANVAGRPSDYIITDTDGIPRIIGASMANYDMTAAIGYIYRGIRVGTGNTPVAIDDYALETPTAEGEGASEMNHLICTVATSVVSAPSCYFVVSRSIVNNSPAEITVREAAIYMKLLVYNGCATRDVLSVPQAVPIGGAITMDWTLQVTV